MGIECVRSQQGIRSVVRPLSKNASTTAAVARTTSSPSTDPPPLSPVSSFHTGPLLPLPNQFRVTETSLPVDALLEPTPLGQLPTSKELEDLVQLYFSSVHREYLRVLFSLSKESS